jgi:hypothetical protein
MRGPGKFLFLSVTMVFWVAVLQPAVVRGEETGERSKEPVSFKVFAEEMLRTDLNRTVRSDGSVRYRNSIGTLQIDAREVSNGTQILGASLRTFEVNVTRNGAVQRLVYRTVEGAPDDDVLQSLGSLETYVG